MNDEVKYRTSQFEADDGSIKVWLQRRDGVYFVRWNDGDEVEVTDTYIASITKVELFYISQLTLLIDNLDTEE
ncbi:hypothetical protein ACO0FP_26715 [Klebsiella pneumoniae]|uniref:hypothetical protein n=1 Tax=Klebsiella pneumoniae TaxID=573 RepID=UPI003BF1596E